MSELVIKTVKQDLINQLNNISKKILINFPVTKYIAIINKYPQYISHKFIGKEIKEITTEIIKLSNISTFEIYHKLILVDLIQYSIDEDLINTFPEEIKNMFFHNFNLILDKIVSPRTRKGFFLNTEDKFNKYMAISRLKMIPCGAQKIYAGSLPRRFLFTGGGGQFLRGMSLILKTGGRKPFYKIHTDSTDKQLMKEFNPEGWNRLFKRIGQLLKSHKDIKGVCGGSWVFDRILKEISPELSYIREISAQYGATFFYQGTDKSTIKDAIFMSPKRIRLYKQGDYMPKSYLMIITRKNLLRGLN